MKPNNIQEKFLSYLEGTLSEQDKKDFETVLNLSTEIKSDYQDFAKTFNALKSMKKQDVKAPQGFDLEVMKAIGELALVNNRSSIMTRVISFVSKGLLSLVTAITFFAVLVYSLSLERGHFFVGKGFALIEGSFGAALMIASIIMAIITFALPKNFKRKVFIPLAPTFAGIAALAFVSRAMVSQFYGTEYQEIPAVSPSTTTDNDSSIVNTFNQSLPIDKEVDTSKPTRSFSKAADEDVLIRGRAPLENKPKSMVFNDRLIGGSNSEAKKFAHYDSLAGTAAPKTEIRKMQDGFSAPVSVSNEQVYVDQLIAYEPVPQVSNTEQYNTTTDNAYLNVSTAPLSTFSIDVDTASYSNIRRFLNGSQLPPKDSVRTEEMLNYFKYDYKTPENKETPFAVTTELSKAPWSEKHQLLHIGLKGYEQDAAQLPASNLVFLVDVSGSMESPEKLPLLKQGLRLLVEQLRTQDRVAIVVYAGAAGVVLDSKEGSQKQEILSAIENLQAGGSTAGGAGIELAYKIAKSHFIENGNNRVVLATDGDFNVGIYNDAELVKLIEEKRKTGIYLSVLGFGMGNYKDGKMEQLANKGNGNYAYIDNIHEAKKVLVNDFRGTIFAIAKDVKIQIEFNPAYVQAYRLIGYENRLLNKEDFNDDRKDAGELGAGHSVTAIYEIVPTGIEFNLMPSVDALKYKLVVSPTPEAKVALNYNQELATVKLRYKLPNEDHSKLISQVVNSIPKEITSDNFRFAAAVAQFGMILRDSEYKGDSTFESTLKLAQNSKGADSLGYRAEFIKLVETAQLLKK